LGRKKFKEFFKKIKLYKTPEEKRIVTLQKAKQMQEKDGEEESELQKKLALKQSEKEKIRKEIEELRKRQGKLKRRRELEREKEEKRMVDQSKKINEVVTLINSKLGKGYSSEKIRSILLKKFPEEIADIVLNKVIESNKKVAGYVEKALSLDTTQPKLRINLKRLDNKR
jgi:hypothetical protein